MKSFAADILAELQNDVPDMIPVIRLTLPDGGGTISLGARDSSVGGLTIQPRVKGWSSFGREVDWKNSDIIQSVWGLELINLGQGDDWESFVGQLSGIQINRIMAELLLFPKHLSNNTSKYITLFKGYLERLKNYNERTCSFDICDGLQHIRCMVGDVMIQEAGTVFANINNDAQGVVMPLIWGKVENSPLINFTKSPTLSLATDITEADALLYLNSWLYRDNGNPLVDGDYYHFFIGSEIIYARYHPTTPNSLDNVTRGALHTVAQPHAAGSAIVRWTASADETIYHHYLAAGHECEDIENLTIDKRVVSANDALGSTNYDLLKDTTYAHALGGTAGVVRLNFPPQYISPDLTSATQIKKIYFNNEKSGNSATDYANVLEVTEGKGIPSGNEPAKIAENQKLYIDINGRDWETAIKSLGKIKKVKLVITGKLTADQDWMDKAGDNVTELKVQCHGKTTSDWFELAKPGKQGEVFIEDQFPHSGIMEDLTSNLGLFPGDNTPNWNRNKFWNGDIETSCHLALEASSLPETGTVRFTLNTSKSSFSRNHISNYDIIAKVYAVVSYDPAIQTYDNNIYKVYTDNSDSGESHNVDLTSTETRDSETHTITDIQRLPDTLQLYVSRRLTVASDLPNPQDFLEAYLLRAAITCQEINNSRINNEFDVTSSFENWDDFDGAYLELQMNSTDQDGIWYEAFDCHFEVEYYPFQPFSTPQLVADVTGRNVADHAQMGNDNEYFEDISRDILDNWILPRAPLAADGGDYFSVDNLSFNAGRTDEGSGKYAFRLDTQMDYIDLLQMLAFEAKRWLFFNNMTWYCYTRLGGDAFGSVDWAISESDIIRGSVNILLTDIATVVNSISGRSKYNAEDQAWTSSVLSTSAASIAKYGTRQIDLDFYAIENYSPSDWNDWYINLLREPRKIYQLEVRTEGIKLERGDIITVTYSPLSLSAEKLQVIYVEPQIPGPGPITTIIRGLSEQVTS